MIARLNYKRAGAMLFSTCLLLYPLLGLGESTPKQTLPEPISESHKEEKKSSYVSVSIEVNELKQAGLALQDATKKLTESLDKAAANVESLSPEQLHHLNQLAINLQGLASQLNNSLLAMPDVIEASRTPIENMMLDSLTQLNEQTIDPSLERIGNWVFAFLMVLIVIAAALVAALIICFNRVSRLGNAIYAVGNGYRLIPLDQYQKLHVENQGTKKDDSTQQSTDKKPHKGLP